MFIFFLIFYAYATTTTARTDGYAVYQYEFATVMAIAAVLAANLFNGLNTYAWTGWVFFAVAVGPVLVLAYTVSQHKVRRAMLGLTTSFPGYLLRDHPRLVLHACLRERSLPLEICILLVRHHPHRCSRASSPFLVEGVYARLPSVRPGQDTLPPQVRAGPRFHEGSAQWSRLGSAFPQAQADQCAPTIQQRICSW